MECHHGHDQLRDDYRIFDIAKHAIACDNALNLLCSM